MTSRFGWLYDRQSLWWRIYEFISPYVALLFLGYLLVSFGDLISILIGIWFEPHPYQKQFSDWRNFIQPFGMTCLLSIVLLDALKYKLTGDPRDQPCRKWWSKDFAQRFLPNEVVILPGNHVVRVSEAVSLQIAAMPVTNCPKCDVTHAFGTNETAPRTCVFYGCGETVSRP